MLSPLSHQMNFRYLPRLCGTSTWLLGRSQHTPLPRRKSFLADCLVRPEARAWCVRERRGSEPGPESVCVL